MSWSVDLFVDAKVPLQQFVREVELICGVKFMKFRSGDRERYEYRDPRGLSAFGTITGSKMTEASTSKTIDMK
jgi:hypothetical protein